MKFEVFSPEGVKVAEGNEWREVHEWYMREISSVEDFESVKVRKGGVEISSEEIERLIMELTDMHPWLESQDDDVMHYGWTEARNGAEPEVISGERDISYEDEVIRIDFSLGIYNVPYEKGWSKHGSAVKVLQSLEKRDKGQELMLQVLLGKLTERQAIEQQ